MPEKILKNLIKQLEISALNNEKLFNLYNIEISQILNILQSFWINEAYHFEVK